MYKGIFSRVKDRVALAFFDSLDYKLAILPPNGATIHRRNSLRQSFGSRAFAYRSGMLPEGETVDQYRKRDPEDYNYVIDCVIEAIKDFGISV